MHSVTRLRTLPGPAPGARLPRSVARIGHCSDDDSGRPASVLSFGHHATRHDASWKAV